MTNVAVKVFCEKSIELTAKIEQERQSANDFTLHRSHREEAYVGDELSSHLQLLQAVVHRYRGSLYGATVSRSYVNVQDFAQQGCWPAHFRMTLLRKRYLLSTSRPSLIDYTHLFTRSIQPIASLFISVESRYWLCLSTSKPDRQPEIVPCEASNSLVRHLSCVNQRRISASDHVPWISMNVLSVYSRREDKLE